MLRMEQMELDKLALEAKIGAMQRDKEEEKMKKKTRIISADMG